MPEGKKRPRITEFTAEFQLKAMSVCRFSFLSVTCFVKTTTALGICLTNIKLVVSTSIAVDCMLAVCCQIDEDIEGTVDFLAKTGPFSVPIRCLKKRCDVIFQVVALNLTELTFPFWSFISPFSAIVFVTCALFINCLKCSSIFIYKYSCDLLM